MEKKLVALVFIASLAGLGGGYGLGHMIYQPQLQKFQNDLNNLNIRFDTINSTVEKMENRTWHKATNLEGSSDVVGPSFQIKGNWVRIRWTMEGSLSTSWIQIILYYSNGTGFAVRGSSGVYSSYACDLEIVQPGQYYIEIVTYEVAVYFVVIWNYY